MSIEPWLPGIPPWGRNPFYDIRMPALGPFVPSAVGRFTHRLTLVFVDVFGALWVIWYKVPRFVFEVIADLIELYAGAGHDDVAAGLS